MSRNSSFKTGQKNFFKLEKLLSGVIMPNQKA